MVSAMFLAETSHMATLQPSAISWRASSRPMPVPPPVTTANLPAKSFMRFPLMCVGRAAWPAARRASTVTRGNGAHARGLVGSDAPPKDAAMKLYLAPGACSLADHIALHEAGFDFDRIKVDTKTKRTEDGRDY